MCKKAYRGRGGVGDGLKIRPLPLSNISVRPWIWPWQHVWRNGNIKKGSKDSWTAVDQLERLLSGSRDVLLLYFPNSLETLTQTDKTCITLIRLSQIWTHSNKIKLNYVFIFDLSLFSLSIFLSIYPFIYQSNYLYIYLSIYPSIYSPVPVNCEVSFNPFCSEFQYWQVCNYIYI